MIRFNFTSTIIIVQERRCFHRRLQFKSHVLPFEKATFIPSNCSYFALTTSFFFYITFSVLQVKNAKLAFNCVGGRSTLILASCLGQDGVLVTYGGMSKQPLQVSCVYSFLRPYDLPVNNGLTNQLIHLLIE